MIKYCMQCDTGKADEARRCKLCRMLSCEACMPSGVIICNHCRLTRVDCAKGDAKREAHAKDIPH